MISINLIDVLVGVGHAKTPTGEDAMGIRFFDPTNNISVEVTFTGDGLQEFLEQIKKPNVTEIEIAQAIPSMGFMPHAN